MRVNFSSVVSFLNPTTYKIQMNDNKTSEIDYHKLQ